MTENHRIFKTTTWIFDLVILLTISIHIILFGILSNYSLLTKISILLLTLIISYFLSYKNFYQLELYKKSFKLNYPLLFKLKEIPNDDILRIVYCKPKLRQPSSLIFFYKENEKQLNFRFNIKKSEILNILNTYEKFEIKIINDPRFPKKEQLRS